MQIYFLWVLYINESLMSRLLFVFVWVTLVSIYCSVNLFESTFYISRLYLKKINTNWYKIKNHKKDKTDKYLSHHRALISNVDITILIAYKRVKLQHEGQVQVFHIQNHFHHPSQPGVTFSFHCFPMCQLQDPNVRTKLCFRAATAPCRSKIFRISFPEIGSVIDDSCSVVCVLISFVITITCSLTCLSKSIILSLASSSCEAIVSLSFSAVCNLLSNSDFLSTTIWSSSLKVSMLMTWS